MADLLAEAIASLNRARIVNVSLLRTSFSNVTYSSLQYVAVCISFFRAFERILRESAVGSVALVVSALLV